MKELRLEEGIRVELNRELGGITAPEGMEERIFCKKSSKRRGIARYAAAAVFAVMFCIVAVAMGPAVTYWFQGVINYSVRNEGVMETLGTVVEKSDTDNGVKITLEAIAGDEKIIYLAFEMEREDGEAFDESILSAIQEKQAFFSTYFLDYYSLDDSSGSSGTSWIDLDKSTDHVIRFYMKEMLETSIPGKFMTIRFWNFSKENDPGKGVLIEGNWAITFRADYPNQSVKLDSNSTKTINGYEVKCKKITVSPLGVSVQLRCRDEKLFEELEKAGKTEEDKNEIYELFLPEIKVVLKDGRTLSGELGGLIGSNAHWEEEEEMFRYQNVRYSYFYSFGELTTLNEIDYVEVYGEQYRMEKFVGD